MKTKHPEQTLASIDTVALANVTGGCAACGCNCPAGAAPKQQQQLNSFAQQQQQR